MQRVIAMNLSLLSLKSDWYINKANHLTLAEGYLN